MPKSSRGHSIGRERAQNGGPGKQEVARAICKAFGAFYGCRTTVARDRRDRSGC